MRRLVNQARLVPNSASHRAHFHGDNKEMMVGFAFKRAFIDATTRLLSAFGCQFISMHFTTRRIMKYAGFVITASNDKINE